jgi:hypothetical protein
MMLPRAFGSLIALAIIFATSFYSYFYTASDRVECDRACIVASGEGP